MPPQAANHRGIFLYELRIYIDAKQAKAVYKDVII